MSKKGNSKKSEQLGMAHGTAANRLRKMIMFSLVQQVGLDTCYRCGEKIDDVSDLSIEHKDPWLDSTDPVGKYFDLSNIAFSHLTCNIASHTQVNKGQIISKHGTLNRYERHGCRCTDCKSAKSAHNRKRYK